jgi:glutathione S-transferase
MYRLYYYPGNANLAPHMLLEELGVPYELTLVDRTNNAHKSGEYLKMNPSGRIPVLIDTQSNPPLVLFETAAICQHLCDRHRHANLAPQELGSPERAQFYKWMAYLSNTLQSELITYFYPDRITDDEAGAAVVRRHAEARIGEMLAILDRALDESGGPWLLGAQYSALDPYLMMLCRWTRGMAKPARTYARLGTFLEAMAARPAVQRTFEQEGLKTPLY